MASKTEKLNELNQKSMETAMRMAQMSVENSQRIMSLQSDLAKDLFQRGLANAKAHSTIRDPKELVQLSTQYAQETTQRLVTAAKEISAVGQDSRAEFSKMLTEQLASGGKEVSNALQGLIKGFPVQPPNVMESIQKAMSTANTAFEQITQASSAAMNAMSQEVKKTTTRKTKS